MPSIYNISYRDTALWLKCRALAAKSMIAEGWNKHAKKFHAVQMRRAVQLYRKGQA